MQLLLRELKQSELLSLLLRMTDQQVTVLLMSMKWPWLNLLLPKHSIMIKSTPALWHGELPVLQAS